MGIFRALSVTGEQLSWPYPSLNKERVLSCYYYVNFSSHFILETALEVVFTLVCFCCFCCIERYGRSHIESFSSKHVLTLMPHGNSCSYVVVKLAVYGRSVYPCSASDRVVPACPLAYTHHSQTKETAGLGSPWAETAAQKAMCTL